MERLGIEVSQRYLDAADLVIFCVEAGRDLSVEERDFLGAVRVPAVTVRTKVDLLEAGARGEGLVTLREALAGHAFTTLAGRGDVEPVVTRARQRAALERAVAEVTQFAAARASGLESAVAATHLRAAVTALEDVIGIVTTEDVLERVFATFCVGK